MVAQEQQLRTYVEWRETFNREFGVTVLDDEGRRRCARDQLLEVPLNRHDAGAYYLWNVLIRRRHGSPADGSDGNRP